MPRSAITMVADASVVVGWLADEPAAARVEAALRRSLTGGGIVVPAHFPVEVANALGVRWSSDLTGVAPVAGMDADSKREDALA